MRVVLQDALSEVTLKEIGKEQSPERVKSPPQKRRAVTRVESAETQDCVSEPQGHEQRDEEEMEELSFIPSTVSKQHWALHMCDNKCRKAGFKFHQLAALVTEEGGAARTINFCKQCYNVMLLKRGERKVTASRWREMIEQKIFRGKMWVALWHGAICAKNVGIFHHQKSMDQISLGRCGKRKGKKGQKLIGNRSRRTKRS